MALEGILFLIFGVFKILLVKSPKREEKITVNQATLLFNDAEEFDSTNMMYAL